MNGGVFAAAGVNLDYMKVNKKLNNYVNFKFAAFHSLRDVRDPNTGDVYTPNTNAAVNLSKMGQLSDKRLTDGGESGIIEERAKSNYVQDPKTGQMMGSVSDGNSGGAGGGGQNILTLAKNRGIINTDGVNGMLNIDVDELVPCLKDSETGEILATEVKELKRSQLKNYTVKNGWNDDWAKRPPDEHIFGVFIKGGIEPQGLISIRNDRGGVYLASGSTAPWNNKQLTGGKQKYLGVGGHLFALAVEQSVKNGWGGTIYGYAVNKKVLQHYIKNFGAVHIPIVHEFQFVIDPEPAKKLLETYTYERS